MLDDLTLYNVVSYGSANAKPIIWGWFTYLWPRWVGIMSGFTTNSTEFNLIQIQDDLTRTNATVRMGIGHGHFLVVSAPWCRKTCQNKASR